MNMTWKAFILQSLILVAVLSVLPVMRVEAQTEVRYVRSRAINVYAEPNELSKIIGELRYLDKVTIQSGFADEREDGVWLRIVSPMNGYIYQRRLIQEEQQAPPPGSSSDRPSTGLTEQGSPSEERQTDGSFRFGFGLSVYTLPEEEGYSSSFGQTADVFIGGIGGSGWLSRFRFGLNITSAASNHFSIDTNSLYGAYVQELDFLGIRPLDAYALAGAADMTSNITKGITGSSAGLGPVLGIGAFLKTTPFGLPDRLKLGLQYLLLLRQGDFGEVKKYVGANQVQVVLSY
jgi:hypothetical protein